MIASVACQGISLFDSACLGCYVHGKAGDIANKTVGIGLTASDIIATCRSIMGENQ
jgi:NAD(P)H-hydrate epimerase